MELNKIEEVEAIEELEFDYNGNIDGIDAEMTDEEILAKLEGATYNEEKVIPIARLGIPITICSISDVKLKNYQKQCTKKKKIKGVITEEFDSITFQNLILMSGIKRPNFSEAFLRKHDCTNVISYLRRTFKAGELDHVVEEIMELSGYHEYDNEGLLVKK